MPRTSKLIEALFPKRAMKFAVPALLLLVNLYFYTNAKALFGAEFAAQWQPVFLFYVLMALAAAAIAPFLFFVGPQQLKARFYRPPSAPIYWQVLLFLGLSLGVWFVASLLGLVVLGALAPPITLATALPAIALEVSTGGTEEVFFRGALGEALGPVWSSIAFGVWHLVAYNADPVNIGIAMALGFVLYFIWASTKDRWGEVINGATHVGLNLAKLVPFLGFLR